MSKIVDVIAALVMATLVAGIALFSAPVWILLFPLRYVVDKAESEKGIRLPLPKFRHLVPVGLSVCVVAVMGLLYATIPPFSMLLKGVGIAIGLLPAVYF
ncbi:MAG: hypothetical protein PHY09_14440 [Desulfuromonadaceae bacterium]|nr:hypothetical protein [Desulfuromonadaceae bacterium]MDD5106261.1 hypothetical protein [Desulfuromonadaceae bacterium]